MVATLAVDNLTVGLPGAPPLLDGIRFDLKPGERVGLVGESGSGKSLTAAALCGLLRPPLAAAAGSVQLDGQELIGASAKTWRRARGNRIFQIFQSPGTALTPASRIRSQLAETARIAGADPELVVPAALSSAALDQRINEFFPYQLSGGMQQRVLIAMALILRPRVLIADEPTTGLDVLTEREILAALNAMADETGSAVLFISHDLRVVHEVADRVLVMQAGRLVEDALIDDLVSSPANAARKLLEAAISLQNGC